jgi:nucleoside 2-deoxyribosyltransferase
MLIYLAGKISGLTQAEASKWRVKAIFSLLRVGIKAHNPLEGFDINGQYEPQEIVIRNKYYIDKSDIILAEMDYREPSPGTIGEIVYAAMKGKPVITWGRAEYNESVWIKAHVTKHFETLEDALDYIVAMYC